jgi:sugar phosphate isomerase/epimerase
MGRMLFGCPFGVSDIRKDYPPRELEVVELKLSGFDELAAYRRNAGSVRDQLRGKVIVVHAPWQFDLAASTDEARREAVRMHEACVDLCSLFDSRLLVAHPSMWHAHNAYYEGTATKDQVLSWLRETVPPLVDCARKSGVTLALENVPTDLEFVEDKRPGDDAREFALLVEELRCRMCFDIGHAVQDIDSFLEHSRLFAHLHISDMAFDLSRQHLMLGDGDIDWAKYSPILLKMDVPSIFEMDRAVYSDDDFTRAKQLMLRA